MSVVEWVLAASSAGPTPDSDYAPPAYSSLGKIGPVVLVFATRVGDSPPPFSGEYNLLRAGDSSNFCVIGDFVFLELKDLQLNDCNISLFKTDKEAFCTPANC